jgi:putative addiction module killer protein
MEMKNPGDARGVGKGVMQMRIDYGPGYRVYFQRSGKEIIILLCGGNKSAQEGDLKIARQLASEWND